MKLDVRLITAADEFLALRSAWDDLSRRVGKPCAFLTHDWFDAAWQWRQDSASLFLLCGWEGGRLVGVLPLVRLNVRQPLGATVLEFLAVPDTQVCDVVADAEHRDAVAGAFADSLARRKAEWDVMRLRNLPVGSVAASALAAALAARTIRSATRRSTENLFVPLNEVWEAYYAGRSRRLKKAINLASNRLAKAGTISIEWCAPESAAAFDADSLVATIADLSARSWKSVTGNSLDNPGPRAFIRRLTEHAAARGWLSVWTLHLDSRPLAMEYQIQADGNVYALRSDFDAECDHISPGSHLSRHLLERLFGRGLDRYLMGPGGNPYKFRWATAGEPVFEMAAYNRSLRGRMLCGWDLAVKPPARRLEKL